MFFLLYEEFPKSIENLRHKCIPKLKLILIDLEKAVAIVSIVYFVSVFMCGSTNQYMRRDWDSGVRSFILLD